MVVAGKMATAPKPAHVCPDFLITDSSMRSLFILLATLPRTDLSHPHFTDGKPECLSDEMTCSLERQGSCIWDFETSREKGIREEGQWHQRGPLSMHVLIHPSIIHSGNTQRACALCWRWGDGGAVGRWWGSGDMVACGKDTVLSLPLDRVPCYPAERFGSYQETLG